MFYGPVPDSYSRLGNDKLTLFGYSSGPEYPADVKLADPPNGYKGYPVRVQGLNEIAFDSDRTDHYFGVISSQDGDARPEFQFLDGNFEIDAAETDEENYDITIEFEATADFTDWDLPPFELGDEEYKISGKVHLEHDGKIGPEIE